jgi:hypothetical protein
MKMMVQFVLADVDLVMSLQVLAQKSFDFECVLCYFHTWHNQKSYYSGHVTGLEGDLFLRVWDPRLFSILPKN